MAFIPPKRVIVPVGAATTPTPTTLPGSFLSKGFVTPDQARKRGGRLRGLMLATEGRSDTGKTEFSMSAPGPGIILACDRGFDAVFDNQNAPAARQTNFGIKVIKMPSATDFTNARDYLPYYQTFYRSVMEAIAIPEARTIVIDGDNFSWDLQRLAEWGKLQGIFPQTRYAEPKAARMSFYHQLWDSGKIIITTNMMKEEWKDVIDPETGLVKVDAQGDRVSQRTGDYVAMGFGNQEYLWSIRIRHLFKAGVVRKIGERTITIPQQWGIRITKCKAKPELVGTELWGENCNFQSLVETIYPHIDLAEWGF